MARSIYRYRRLPGIRPASLEQLHLCCSANKAFTADRPSARSAALAQNVDTPHGVAWQKIVMVDDGETALQKLRLDVGAADHKAITLRWCAILTQATGLLALAPPGFDVAIDPESDDRGVTGDPVKLFENRQTLFTVSHVMEQPHAKDAIDGVGRQTNGECRTLEGSYPLAHLSRRLRFGDLQHVGRGVGCQDHPIGVFS